MSDLKYSSYDSFSSNYEWKQPIISEKENFCVNTYFLSLSFYILDS